MKNLIIWILFLFVCVMMLVIGLWPFSFRTENNVRRLNKEAGIEFYNLGIAFTNSQNENISFNRFSKQIDAISVEIWLNPDKEPRNKVSDILCFYDDKVPPTIDIGQKNASLIIRIWNKSKSYFKKYNKVALHHALPKGKRRFLTIILGVNGTTIYIDGKRSRYCPNRGLLHGKNNFPSFHIVLGNDPTGKNPWNGKIYGLSIYDKELSQSEVSQNYENWIQGKLSKLLRKTELVAIYPMDETQGQWIYNRLNKKNNLWIPGEFQVPKPLIFSPPIRSSSLDINDIIVNVLGFIPFGFLCLAYFSSNKRFPCEAIRLILIVILVGSLLSLLIEFLQIYLPTRHSSLTDLICNIIGTATGALLYYFAIQKYITSNQT